MKLVLFLLLAAIPIQVRSQASSSEYGIKAAYLLNFTKYTEWPNTKFTSKNSPLVICILGEDPFGQVLDKTFEGKETIGRKIEIQRMKNYPSQGVCHLVYFKRNHSKEQEEILKTMKGSNVLTVGETEGFAENGGMIAFINLEDTIQFEVNLKNVEQGGLKLSSRMLTFAKKVLR